MKDVAFWYNWILGYVFLKIWVLNLTLGYVLGHMNIHWDTWTHFWTNLGVLSENWLLVHAFEDLVSTLAFDEHLGYFQTYRHFLGQMDPFWRKWKIALWFVKMREGGMVKNR